MPLLGAGTSTAFLSSVRPTHCSTSRASRSISSSDFSGYKMKRDVDEHTTNTDQRQIQTTLQVLHHAVAVTPGLRLTVFVDDFLDLFIEVLSAFNQSF